MKTVVFVIFCAKIVWVKMWVKLLTHTVTHTGNYAERHKNTGQEIAVSCPVFYFFGGFALPGHEAAHGLCRFVCEKFLLDVYDGVWTVQVAAMRRNDRSNFYGTSNKLWAYCEGGHPTALVNFLEKYCGEEKHSSSAISVALFSPAANSSLALAIFSSAMA